MVGNLDDFEAIAARRRSVRAFMPLPVEQSLIERALAAAATAPSSCNTQPWAVHIVSGERLEKLRAALVEAVRAGQAPAPEVEQASPYEGVYRARQIDSAVRLFRAQGVERHDRTGRQTSFLRNYAFFDAPHVAFLFIPASGGLREAADCGKFAQTLMLAFAAAGVGSCPQGSLSDYPGIVRRTLDLEETGRLLMGISFGYADETDNTVTVRPSRIAVRSFTQFH
jgi:nitroreductase